MKLASLNNGTRDGRLVVVSRDLTRYTDASFLVPTLQAALDNWARIAPHLATMAESLELRSVPNERFHEHDALSPLPRAYQSSEGGVFAGPRDPVGCLEKTEITAGYAAIVADVAPGAAKPEAAEAIALVALFCAASSGRTAFSPVAVTLDELDGAVPPLVVSVGGKAGPHPVSADFAAWVSVAANAHGLSAGAIVTAGKTEKLRAAAGATVRVEAKDGGGHTIFGAIERAMVGEEQD